MNRGNLCGASFSDYSDYLADTKVDQKNRVKRKNKRNEKTPGIQFCLGVF